MEFNRIGYKGLAFILNALTDHKKLEKLFRKNNNMDIQSIINYFEGEYNELEIPTSLNGPMCYPFYSRIPELRKHLIANKIYVPTYWPDAEFTLTSGTLGKDFVEHLHAIPCDQRYGFEDIKLITEILIKLIDGGLK